MTLRVVSAGAAQGLVRSLAERHRIEIEGHFGAVGAMWEELQRGEPVDVVVLTKPQVAKLAMGLQVEVDSVVELGSAATSIAVRSGAQKPDVHDAVSLMVALRAADAIYFPDPQKATAGVHFEKVLRELGLHDALASRLKTFANGSTAMAAMAKASGRPLGCTQATEILATEGVTLVAPLPPPHGLSTIYCAAVHARTADERAARRFVKQLGSAELAAERRRAGFE